MKLTAERIIDGVKWELDFDETGKALRLRCDGQPVPTIPDDQAGNAKFVVCAYWNDPQVFPDDVRGKCVSCDVDLRCRPIASRTVAPICIPCVLKVATAQ